MGTAVEPGAVIDGKYRVIRRIGEGGMGTVYEGENIRIERKVAIKVLHAHVASTPEFAQRFEREARASARIGSPNVCDVLDLGDLPNGDRFIVMEYLDGESLEDRLERGQLTASQLAPIAFEILDGLGTMHQAGVVHRDLKPANVFLARRGKGEMVKILDFGVAKILPRADEPNQMTSTGMMMGTPLYMSPEQARGARDVDGRTDLYAASVIFYRALTGEVPHTADNLHELLFKIVLEEPKPIREIVPDVDEAFAKIVTRGLARDADQRFASAREYQEAIAAWGATQGRTSMQFAVTLSSERPPLKSLSSGYPIAKMQVPITGPQPRSEQVGPPTPALAKTQTETTGAAPATKQSGGTPVVWSEDAPEVAKKVLAELEAKKRAVSKGDTALIESKPSVSASSASASTAESPPAPPARSQTNWGLVGALALFVIAGAGFGMRLVSRDSTARSSSQAASTQVAQVTSEPSLAPPPVPSAPLANSAPTAEVTTASAPPVAPHPTATTLRPTPHAAAATAAPKAVPSASASAPKPVTSTVATTSPPAPTTSARKFRTNLE